MWWLAHFTFLVVRGKCFKESHAVPRPPASIFRPQQDCCIRLHLQDPVIWWLVSPYGMSQRLTRADYFRCVWQKLFIDVVIKGSVQNSVWHLFADLISQLWSTDSCHSEISCLYKFPPAAVTDSAKNSEKTLFLWASSVNTNTFECTSAASSANSENHFCQSDVAAHFLLIFHSRYFRLERRDKTFSTWLGE